MLKFKTDEEAATYWADWVVDAVATATQNRMFLRGDPKENKLSTECIEINAKKAILNALAGRQEA